MTLRELTVEGLATVERVRLELAPGFTVLTGETGAGKSLVVDAVSLVLGARANADLVRAGADAARVEAVFDAPAVADEEPLADVVAAGEGTLIVRREVAADGRSSVRVNDRAVTVGGLAALAGRIGEIHGQHDQQRLLEAGHQLALLDAYGGHEPLLAEVAISHREWRAAAAAASELLTDARELARRIELLRHQAGEIDAAAPRAGEDAELEAQLRAAAHAETIVRSAQAAVAALRDDAGAADALGLAERGLVTAAAHDDRFGPLAERAASLAAEAAELARDAGVAAEAVDLDPASRAAAEERLALLYDLRRKYGDSLEAVIAFGRTASEELERLENADGERARLAGEEERLRGDLERVAAMLSAARLAAADRLTTTVNAELPPLGLPAGAFGVVLEPTDPGPGGADLIAFTFAPNPGEPPRPLARIASGGEASRVSLALKVVVAAADATPLLVFDEIDAGIGGRNALELGQRLRALSVHHQVLCVTHLPQVAAHADAHIVIGKREADGRTVTEARRLTGDERAAELAAMLAGADAGSEARAAADALLRAATR